MRILIKEGSIDILSINSDGSELLLTTLQAPEVFGENSMFLESVHNATARARTTSTLFQLNREMSKIKAYRKKSKIV